MVAFVTVFWKLGDRPIAGDEAQYALAADHMRASGNWVDVMPIPPSVSFQKPPLYLWLDLLTHRTYEHVTILRQPEATYRINSALFAVGACAVTAWLATQLLGPWGGFISGLMLAVNPMFLFWHGARNGTFDSALTFCHVTAFAVWWRWGDRRVAWVAVGLLAGAASLFKPFAGVPTLLLLAVCELVRRPRRWASFGIAVGVAALVALPWFVAEWVRHGQLFYDDMFVRNLATRAAVGIEPRHVQGPLYYGYRLPRASPFFKLTWPALAWALWRGWRGAPSRQTIARLLIAGFGWVGLFSLSASKADHYLFPAFPFVAILIACLLADLEAMVRTWPRPEMLLATGRLTIAIILIVTTSRILRGRAGEADVGPTIAPIFHDRSLGLSRGGEVLLVDWPAEQGEWRNQLGLTPGDCYYLERMTGRRFVGRLDALAATDSILFVPVHSAIEEPLRTKARMLESRPLFSVWRVGPK